MEIELAKALIWTLRIVLPIILFCIYFKLQSPGKDEPSYPGPTKNSYSRGRILARRAIALESAEVPAELASLSLKDQTQAPELFAAPTRQLRGATRREDRREPRGDRRERREQPRSREFKVPETQGAAEEASAATDTGAPPTEERMHAEALINYVAFNRKEQQRIFLPDEAGRPPPPPKPRQLTQTAGVAIAAGAAASAADGVVPEDVARKANADAQLVLRGAISFKRSDVAKEIYEQLTDTKVTINEQNFILMIEACVLASDLKSASDFLMKMEMSGFCPDSNILDRVMDLYSQQKVQNQEEKKKAAAAAEEAKMMQETGLAGATTDDGGIQAALDELLDSEPRKKLSSGAPIFVPGLSADAPVFVPSFGGGMEAPPPPPPPPEPLEAAEFLQQPQQEESAAIPAQRTRLTAAAKPFQPTYGCGGFDSYTYTWSPGGAEN